MRRQEQDAQNRILALKPRQILSQSYNESLKVEFKFESYKMYLLQSIKKINKVHVK